MAAGYLQLGWVICSVFPHNYLINFNFKTYNLTKNKSFYYFRAAISSPTNYLMKKLIYIILGFIIGAALTYYFCPRPNSMDDVEVSVKVPKDTISVSEAKILSDNWEKNNAIEVDSLLEVEGSKKKTRSVWWPLKEINEYLKYAEAKSDSLGYKMTGVRIYLGNYGKVKNPIKKNRNTMFIVPTGSKTTSKASTLNVFLPPTVNDIPTPPLNEGQGGDVGYPQ